MPCSNLGAYKASPLRCWHQQTQRELLREVVAREQTAGLKTTPIETMKSSTLLVILCLQAALVMGIFAAVAKENGTFLDRRSYDSNRHIQVD